MEPSTNNEATKTVESTDAPHYLCFVTNRAYAPGAVCLAQSLHLVQSNARLRVIATSIAAQEALLTELAASPNPSSIPMDVVLEETPLPTYSHDKTHNGRGATLAVDAPRRCLFDDKRDGWILLDADLIACVETNLRDHKQYKFDFKIILYTNTRHLPEYHEFA